VNAPGEHDFPAETQTLIQALGRVAGLQDSRADRNGLFVFRQQSVALTSDMLGDKKASAQPNVIYHLDMKAPTAFFLASGFQIRPEDVLFVSNSPMADLSKVLNLITGLGLVAATPRNFGVTP
jgi:polysaccharide export outer membrane protein